MDVAGYLQGSEEALAAAVAKEIARAKEPLAATLVSGDAASVSAILAALKRVGVPYAAPGRWLFLAHPWIRAFLLALKGLADDDPVGQACLLSRPFFPLGIEERVQRVTSHRQMSEACAQAWKHARTTVRKLRVRAHRGGATSAAILLAEETAFLAHPSFCGPNQAVEREMFWMLVSTIEGESWKEKSDLIGFVAKLDRWLKNPATLGQKLQRRLRSGPLQVVSPQDLDSYSAVDILVLTGTSGGPSRTTWRVLADGIVELEDDVASVSIPLEVRRALLVPAAG